MHEEFAMKKKKKTIPVRTWVSWIALLKFCAISLYLLRDSMVDIFYRFQQMFGAVTWLFIILILVLLAEILHLVLYRSCNVKNLDFIEAASPPVGLLGTVFALMGGFANLNLGGMKLEDAITVIVLAIAVSLKTTAAGIICSLIAMAVRERLAPILHRKENHDAHREEIKSYVPNSPHTIDCAGTADDPGLALAELR
jgi:hypothetical protein